MSISPVGSSDPYASQILNRISAAGNTPAAQGKVVAQQFEAILMRQFLDKSVGSMMGGGAGSDVYGYMLTEALAQKLSEGGGLGLSAVLQRQFTPAGAAAAAPGAGTSSTAVTPTSTLTAQQAKGSS